MSKRKSQFGLTTTMKLTHLKDQLGVDFVLVQVITTLEINATVSEHLLVLIHQSSILQGII